MPRKALPSSEKVVQSLFEKRLDALEACGSLTAHQKQSLEHMVGLLRTAPTRSCIDKTRALLKDRLATWVGGYTDRQVALSELKLLGDERRQTHAKHRRGGARDAAAKSLWMLLLIGSAAAALSVTSFGMVALVLALATGELGRSTLTETRHELHEAYDIMRGRDEHHQGAPLRQRLMVATQKVSKGLLSFGLAAVGLLSVVLPTLMPALAAPLVMVGLAVAVITAGMALVDLFQEKQTIQQQSSTLMKELASLERDSGLEADCMAEKQEKASEPLALSEAHAWFDQPGHEEASADSLRSVTREEVQEAVERHHIQEDPQVGLDSPRK